MTQDTISIETMSESDLDAVVELDNKCFTSNWKKEDYQSWYDDPRSYCLIARINNEVVGAAVSTIDDVSIIATVSVDEQYRRRGIAKKFLASIIEESKLRGSECVSLYVRPSNTGALALYHSFGFVVGYTISKYYHDNNEDAYAMHLNL